MLLARVGALLVLVWAVTFALLLVLPLTFPDWESAVMQTCVLALLGAFAMAGLLRFRWKGFIRATLLISCLVLTVVITARIYFTNALEHAYDKDQIIAQMQVLRDGIPVKVYQSTPDIPTENRAGPALDRIHQRGFIRVGYFKDHLPLVYVNAAGELVGFDVAMAHRLARALKVAFEFVPVERGKVAKALDAGYCDIMIGTVVTLGRAPRMAFSLPYLDLTWAVLVKDHRRDEFNSRDALGRLEGRIPMAYPVALGNKKLLAFVNAWIDLKKRDGTIKRLYDYWILGKNAAKKKLRWSVLRDVLHWVD